MTRGPIKVGPTRQFTQGTTLAAQRNREADFMQRVRKDNMAAFAARKRPVWSVW